MMRNLFATLLVLFAIHGAAQQQERREERREQRREERREQRRRERRRSQQAQPSTTSAWTGILDSSRAIDWTRAGVFIRTSTQAICRWSTEFPDCVSGLPTNRTQCGATVTPSGLTPTTVGLTDANLINNALQACGANQYVQLGPGTFYIVNGTTFGGPYNSNAAYKTSMSNVTLRGSGPTQTILKALTAGSQGCGGSGNVICMSEPSGTTSSQFNPYAAGCTLTAGYTKGSITLTVGTCVASGTNPTMPVVGQPITIDQRTDDIGLTGCTSTGTTATCTVASPTLPPEFVVGACVGVAAVNNIQTTNLATGYNRTAWTGSDPVGNCNPITAVSGNTFSYTLAAGGNNLAATTNCWTTAAQVQSGSLPCTATVDTGGQYVTGAICVTVDGSCPSNAAPTINLVRTCPDIAIPTIPTCATGEVSMRAQVEVVVVTAVSGNQITIDPPLSASNWRASNSPGIFWFAMTDYLQNAGLENLTADAGEDGGTTSNGSISMTRCLNCWIRNVRSIYGSRNHVWTGSGTTRVTIRDSYFFGTKRGSTQSYGIELSWISQFLVENNLFYQVSTPLIGGNGSNIVHAYNYSLNNGSSTYYWMGGMGFFLHGVSCFFLFEGNSTTSDTLDNIHGTACGAHTSFRERLKGQDIPLKQNNLTTLQDSSFNRSVNYIGDVLGSVGMQTGYLTQNNTNLCNGYQYCVGGTSQNGNNIPIDPLVQQTLVRWGNYDVVTGATRWCGTVGANDCVNGTNITGAFPYIGANPIPSSHTLPNSFYLSGQPSWFTTKWGTSHWPPNGPDVTGGNASDNTCALTTPCTDAGSGMSYPIPSQIVFEHAPLDTNYADSTSNTISNISVSGTTGTITGHFLMPIFMTFRLSNMTPAGYNGVFQNTSLDGPTNDPSTLGNVYAGGNMVPGQWRYTVTRINDYVDSTHYGETTKSGVVSTFSISGTCPTSGNCDLRVTAPCVATTTSCPQNGTPAGNPHAGTYYNVYVRPATDTTGKMCRANATPIPITQTCGGLSIACFSVPYSSALNGSDPGCITPPTVSTAASTTATFYITNNPGTATGGTLTEPLIQQFDANQYYGNAVAPPAAPGITGQGRITGNGKIT